FSAIVARAPVPSFVVIWWDWRNTLLNALGRSQFTTDEVFLRSAHHQVDLRMYEPLIANNIKAASLPTPP
ncbi:MAG: hypothetical protein J4G04_01560, partial [Nitrosopumilaceae archaeon]|nr:hypothetical protein [Nitrosopumilaceae archaeon]